MERTDLLKQSVELIMTSDVTAVQQDTAVRKAASIMAKKGFGCLIVVAGNLAVGIVTERDIVHKVTAEGIDPSKVLIQDIMSTPLITVDRKATLREAAEKISAYGVRGMVVTFENGKLIGLVTAGDFARWLAAQENYSDPALNAMARMRRGGIGSPYK
ncbi:MAG: CBS domain-containing protein [Nitrososphaerales archaeon]